MPGAQLCDVDISINKSFFFHSLVGRQTCRQEQYTQTKFRGGPEKGEINPIWNSSRMWWSPRGGNSELVWAKYTEILHIVPRDVMWKSTDNACEEQLDVLLNHKVQV